MVQSLPASTHTAETAGLRTLANTHDARIRNVFTVTRQGVQFMITKKHIHYESLVDKFFIAEYGIKRADKIQVMVSRSYVVAPNEEKRKIKYYLTMSKEGGKDKTGLHVDDSSMDNVEFANWMDMDKEKDDLDAVEAGIFMCELAKLKGDYDA